LPVRVEDVRPGPELDLFLATVHWFDAFTPPIERHLESLARSVKTHLVNDSGLLAKTKANRPLEAATRVTPGPIGEIPSPAGGIPTVFISSKSADYIHAKQVYAFLMSKGVHCFFSDESLPRLGNSDYRQEIDRALDLAKHLVVVTTSAQHVNSPWVEAEWGFFVQEKRSGRKPGNIVTLVVGDLPPQKLPPSLRYYEVLTLTAESLGRVLRYVEK
jgi:hypothetical protein